MKEYDIAQKCKDGVVNLILDTMDRKKQALVFVNTKRGAAKSAEEISKKIKTEDPFHAELSEKILSAIPQPTRQCRRLAECVKRGIAFHHAGLASKQRELIEDAFRQKKLWAICCTPTLAMGVDLPAFRSVIRDLKRYGHRGMQYIPVLEYHQMAGRAGRPSFDEYGEVICIASGESEKETIVEDYIHGEPEDIYSKLAVEPVLRFYLLSLIATGMVNRREKILEFFEKTFWAHQYKDMARLEKIIDKMLDLLEEWEFITSSTDDFVSADEMDDTSYKTTQLGKRVAELYIDPLSANTLISGIQRASSKRLIHPFAFLQLICNTGEMRPLLSIGTKDWDGLQEKLAQFDGELLDLEPSMYEPEYEDFLRSVKTALMLHDWIEEKEEDYLLEKYRSGPGETRIKLTNGDWLLYSAYELTRILNFRHVLKEITKLRIRLKHGAKEELLTLLKLKDIGRVRARLLFRNGIRDIRDVKKANVIKLAQLLGKGTALKVKKQVGQDIEASKVPDRRRKGQLSLGKF